MGHKNWRQQEDGSSFLSQCASLSLSISDLKLLIPQSYYGAMCGMTLWYSLASRLPGYLSLWGCNICIRETFPHLSRVVSLPSRSISPQRCNIYMVFVLPPHPPPFSFMRMVFCLHICLDEGVKLPRTGAAADCELPHECLELNPGSSGQAASVLNHRAISPASVLLCRFFVKSASQLQK